MADDPNSDRTILDVLGDMARGQAVLELTRSLQQLTEAVRGEQ